MAGMRLRKLRIAWSVGWGLACVLLIVLWVRSYSWEDALVYSNAKQHTFSCDSARGLLKVVLNDTSGRLSSLFPSTSGFSIIQVI
jgi:hypothetical protein